ncbi:MAG: hypothetical protein M3381_02785 [Actinomycetota bacterium]|nr:hypothetical protein [Actinomycetota bacterium]
MAAALLVVGLVAGAVAGYVVGHSNPPVFGGIYGYSLGSGNFAGSPLDSSAFDQTYGRTPLPMLTPEDLAALGENVTRQFSVLSGQSAIPTLCATIVGQPGYSPDNRYPSTVFRVDGGNITQLIWSRADDASASGTLQTLASQAQVCPEVPNSEAMITTGGVQSGIGDEYAVFRRTPTVSGPTVFFATVALVRVGADLIEVSFISDAIDLPDAEARCLRAAVAAVQMASGG